MKIRQYTKWHFRLRLAAFAVLCALTWCVAPASATAAKDSDIQPPEQSLDVGSSGSSQDAVIDLLTVLRQGHLLPDNDPHVRRRMLEALLEVVECGGEVLPAVLESDDVDDAAENRSCVTATVGGMFAYVRIEDITEHAVSTIGDFVGDADHGHYEGIIIDVRYTRAGSVNAAGDAAEVLSRAKLPVIVLINRETIGPAEILATLTRQQCGATIVGQATRGFPFGWRRVRLGSGDIVLLPEIEPESGQAPWKPTPLAPDVFVTQVLPRSALARNHGYSRVQPVTERDQCLRKAVDLLTTIYALDRKHF